MRDSQGIYPLSYTEINAYSNCNGKLSAWESEQLVAMSRDYCLYKQLGEDRNCDNPYIDSDLMATTPDASGFTAMFDALQ